MAHRQADPEVSAYPRMVGQMALVLDRAPVSITSHSVDLITLKGTADVPAFSTWILSPPL